MFTSGLIINAYGMGIYISAGFGAGPRDSLMLAITQKTGWKVQYVRASIEIIVLLIGWQLGGPVFLGTVLFGLLIGPLSGFTLRQTQKLTNSILDKILRGKQPLANETKRGVKV